MEITYTDIMLFKMAVLTIGAFLYGLTGRLRK
jgi:hypothetical protein